MPISEINGTRLHWERRGSGERLLFCNGSGSTLAEARPLLELLGGGFDLLAFDYRGFGPSDRVAGPYSMADIAGDVCGLLDLVEWEDCRVVGVSFGGMVAMEFAVTHPERVERLVLACTSPGGDGGASYPLHTLSELPSEERAATRLKLADRRWDDRWLETHPLDRALADVLIARTNQRGPSEADAAHEAQLRARAGHDVWDRLAAIACPTLVACGRHDGIAPVENSEAIASRIRGSELRRYDGGHLFLFQDPAAAPEIVRFLQWT
jgi:3-oxoadipate enol-lactonase